MSSPKLSRVYEGWEGYNTSLVHAVRGLSDEQLAFRAAAEMRSVGELAWHLSHGRMHWFSHIDDDARALFESMPATAESGEALAEWLERTWAIIAAVLDRWTVEDLEVTFKHPYQGKVFLVSRQWVIWRILSHDQHHGGQLSELLAMQGIVPTELTLLGGHLTEPPTVSG